MARLSSRVLGRRSAADKLWSLLRQLGPDGVPTLRHELTEMARRLRSENSELPPEDAADFVRYLGPIGAASTLFGFFGGSPITQLASLHTTVLEADEELGSGGPPISPVHDSLFVTWNVLDLKIGRTTETLASVTRAILRKLKVQPEWIGQLEALEAEPLGIFTVEGSRPARVGDSARYRLRDVVTERELWVQFLEDYDVRTLDFVMVRPTPLPADREALRGVSHLCYTTPYVFGGQSPAAWRDYFERAAGELGARLDEASYLQVMRGVGNPRRWLDFVFEGYVGERDKNLVEVVGLPDLPHTLPHHEDYDASDEIRIPPGADPTTRSQLLITRTLRQLRDLGERGLPTIAPEITHFESLGGNVSWVPMLIAIALSEGTASTQPLLDLLETENAFDDDMQEWIDAIRAGTTSLFEVLSVDKGHGMRVCDALGEGEWDLVERLGSQSISPGFLLFGRVVHYRGVDMFENVHPETVPPEAVEHIVTAVGQALDGRPMHGADAVKAAKAWEKGLEAWKHASMPRLATTTGEPLVLCAIEMAFAPERRDEVVNAVRRMRRTYEVTPEEGSVDRCFHVLTKTEMVEARIAITEKTIFVESNAQKRLDRVVARIRSKAPGLSVLRRSQMDPNEMMRAMREHEER